MRRLALANLEWAMKMLSGHVIQKPMGCSAAVQPCPQTINHKDEVEQSGPGGSNSCGEVKLTTALRTRLTGHSKHEHLTLDPRRHVVVLEAELMTVPLGRSHLKASQRVQHLTFGAHTVQGKDR